MAQNTDIDVVPSAWTLLTNGDVTAGAFQCRGAPVLLKATVGAVEPTTDLGAIRLEGNEGINGNLIDYWRGVTGANRVYGKAENFAAKVFTSHA